MSLPRLYTPAEVGSLTGHSADWVSRRAREGKFEHTRVGVKIRFTAAQVETLIATCTRPALDRDGQPIAPSPVPVDPMVASLVTRRRRQAA